MSKPDIIIDGLPEPAYKRDGSILEIREWKNMV
jgi:hypothetical protein